MIYYEHQLIRKDAAFSLNYFRLQRLPTNGSTPGDVKVKANPRGLSLTLGLKLGRREMQSSFAHFLRKI